MDFIGNAWEATADKMMDSKEYDEQWKSLRQWNGQQRYLDFEIDPLLKGERRLIRVGFWDQGTSRIGHKISIGDNDRFPAIGFRVCIGEPLGNWNNATTTTSNLVENAFSLNAAPGRITELILKRLQIRRNVAVCNAGVVDKVFSSIENRSRDDGSVTPFRSGEL